RAHARPDGLDFSNLGDTGLTEQAGRTQLQIAGSAPAVSKMGSAVESLVAAMAPNQQPEHSRDRWPLTNRPDVEEKIRAEGFEPVVIWQRFLEKNERRIAKGKGPINVKDDLGRYLVSIAKDEAAKRRHREIVPGALAEFRNSRGPIWRPRNRH